MMESYEYATVLNKLTDALKERGVNICHIHKLSDLLEAIELIRGTEDVEPIPIGSFVDKIK